MQPAKAIADDRVIMYKAKSNAPEVLHAVAVPDELQAVFERKLRSTGFLRDETSGNQGLDESFFHARVPQTKER